MMIKIHTDNSLEGTERMETYFTSVVDGALTRFEENITRIDVYLGDENNGKFGTDDKRCTIEAHMAGRPPLAVVNHSDTIEKAVNGALDKMKRVLETTFSKLRNY